MNARRWQWRHRLRKRERCDALVPSAPPPGDNRRICWRAFVSGGCREEVAGLSDERVRGRTCCADAGSPGHCTRRLAIISSPGQLSRVFPLHILETSHLWRKKSGNGREENGSGVIVGCFVKVGSDMLLGMDLLHLIQLICILIFFLTSYYVTRNYYDCTKIKV